jgi:hypothetical protein
MDGGWMGRVEKEVRKSLPKDYRNAYWLNEEIRWEWWEQQNPWPRRIGKRVWYYGD